MGEEKKKAAEEKKKAAEEKKKAEEEKKKAEEEKNRAAEEKKKQDEEKKKLEEKKKEVGDKKQTTHIDNEKLIKDKEAKYAALPMKERSSQQLQDALKLLKENTTLEELKTAIATLKTFIKNIMTNHGEPRFQRIRRTNELMLNTLGRKPGGLLALHAIGFKHKGDADTHLVLIPSKEAWEVLVASNEAIENVSKQVQESEQEEKRR